MKKILMAAVALICMTMTSVVLTACSTETKSIIKTETVTYQLVYNLEVATGHNDVVNAFSRDMTNAVESVGMVDISESDLIKRLQAVVDTYNNKYLRGTVDLQKSYNGSSNWTIVKTFTLTAAESE